MIKKFDDWKDEQKLSFGEEITPEIAYNAAVKEAKNHYEEEAIATHEYYDKMFKDVRKQYEPVEIKSTQLSEEEHKEVSEMIAAEKYMDDDD